MTFVSIENKHIVFVLDIMYSSFSQFSMFFIKMMHVL